MAYTTIDNPELYFQVKTYSGTGSSNAITLDGDENMQPDLVYLKRRDDGAPPMFFDAIRGATKRLQTNNTDAEATGSQQLTAFGSDGFTVGTNEDANHSSGTYVAWCWKAGTSFSNDASATSVGSIDSTGSISTAAGISIMSYTGNGTANQSVAHGLGATPKFIIIKNRDTAGYWCVTNPRFVSVSDPNMLYFDTAAEADDTNINGTTAPSSTVFGVDDYGAVNTSGDDHIAYCFAEKQGFSKFGSYTGNGNADGPFIYTGFKPAWVLIKTSSYGSQNWNQYDTKRDTGNITEVELNPNDNSPDDSSGNKIDILSNGFKCRVSLDATNRSGETYIYMAFAEAPFVNSNGVPNNAR